MNKRGQIKLSFGMIFSVVLIIIFIAFAVYGISKFLSLQKNVQIKKFADDFQNDVDRVWRSGSSSETYSYLLPKGARVCFNEGGGENLLIRKEDSFLGSYSIEHVIFEDFCVNEFGGRVRLKLDKNHGDFSVTVTGP